MLEVAYGKMTVELGPIVVPLIDGKAAGTVVMKRRGFLSIRYRIRNRGQGRCTGNSHELKWHVIGAQGLGIGAALM